VLGTILVALLPRGAAAAAPATSVGPVPLNSAVSFFVRENDVRKVPAPGVVVTMTVITGAGDGATVAPADRTGAITAATGASAQSTTDRLGNAYFRLVAAHTSGVDTYSWNDGHGHTGQVLVTVSATATLSATPSAVSVVAGATTPTPSPAAGASTAVTTASSPTAPAAATPLWRTAVTGLAAVLLAGALLFVLPRLVRRIAARRARVQSPDS
jgi:hypothetical protein